MPQIIVENLVKTFQVSERRPGLGGAVVGLVALAGLDKNDFGNPEGGK